MRWKTKEVKDAIRDLKLEGMKTIHTQNPGGDVDTEVLIVDFGEECLWISGFKVEGDIANPKDTDVDMIEVTDGRDSRGGFNGEDELVGAAYGRITSMLRTKFKASVVPSMKAYF